VGKSTLINCVFRGELAKTGSGVPVTQQIEEIAKDGHPITIIDSKGLELKDYKQIFSDLKDYIQDRSNDHDENKHIHAAWVCIQEGSDRVEAAEKELCDLLRAEGIPVIIAVTKSAFIVGETFTAELRKEIAAASAIVKVRSIDTQEEDEDGNIFNRRIKGIDELITETARLIPDAKKRAFANALSSKHKSAMKLKIEQAQIEVNVAAGLAAAAGATPIPFSDSFVLVPIQVGMLAKIGITFGMEVSTSALTTLVTSVLGASAATLIGRAVVTGLLKMIPGVGSAIGGTIAGTTALALTKGLGTAYIAILTEFCDKNPGKELDIHLIGEELKRRMKI
jgi:uncharacterized protein (DUF697 family)/GTP-binding protein EngB required for normal cell division